MSRALTKESIAIRIHPVASSGYLGKRIRQLDVLRAMAVLLVTAGHMSWHPIQGQLSRSPILGRIGWTGVDLFFCLSGFLISGLLFRDYKSSGQIHWLRFIIRRGFKIYPAYYTLLLGTVIFYRIPWSNLWPDLIFVQDYKVGSWGHLWSLGIEEQFYLLLPFALWLMAGKRFRALPWVCAVVAVACLAMRAFQFYNVKPFEHHIHIRPFHLRFDALFFGVMLSYFNEFRPEVLKLLLRGKGRVLLAVSLLCLSPALFHEQADQFMYIYGLTLLYLGYGGILLYSLFCLKGEGLLVRFLCRIGQSSYSIYLWHLPAAVFAIDVLQNRFHWGANPVLGAYMVMSLGVGIGMAYAVERPALRLRERLFPDRPSVVGQSSAPSLISWNSSLQKPCTSENNVY